METNGRSRRRLMATKWEGWAASQWGVMAVLLLINHRPPPPTTTTTKILNSACDLHNWWCSQQPGRQAGRKTNEDDQESYYYYTHTTSGGRANEWQWLANCMGQVMTRPRPPPLWCSRPTQTFGVGPPTKSNLRVAPSCHHRHEAIACLSSFFLLFNFLLIASFQWRLISSRDACAIYAKLGLRGGTISFHVWQNFCPPAAAVRTDNRSPDLPFPVVNLSKLRHPSVMLCNLAFCNKFCFAFLPVGRSLLTNYSSITQQATKPLK